MMKAREILLPLAALLLMASGAAAQLSDYRGYKDPAMFSRMPNFFLPNESSVVDKPFDARDFPVKKNDSWENQRVEGHLRQYAYEFDSSRGAPAPSGLQVIRNYQNAGRKIGGEILYDDGPYTTMRFVRDGKETWVYVDASSITLHVDIVEKQAMQQDVTANAGVMQNGLAKSGHAEVPGILFDFGKSEVKPGSEPALTEVVKLLQGNPRLNAWVVGHTDNVGTVASNLALSNARAAAVVKVLTQKMGVDPKRLAPYGAGPYAPVSSNETEDGRTQNRRVELVAQQP